MIEFLQRKALLLPIKAPLLVTPVQANDLLPDFKVGVTGESNSSRNRKKLNPCPAQPLR